MAKHDSNSGPEIPERTGGVSATGMFLHAIGMDTKPKHTSKAPGVAESSTIQLPQRESIAGELSGAESQRSAAFEGPGPVHAEEVHPPDVTNLLAALSSQSGKPLPSRQPAPHRPDAAPAVSTLPDPHAQEPALDEESVSRLLEKFAQELSASPLAQPSSQPVNPDLGQLNRMISRLNLAGDAPKAADEPALARETPAPSPFHPVPPESAVAPSLSGAASASAVKEQLAGTSLPTLIVKKTKLEAMVPYLVLVDTFLLLILMLALALAAWAWSAGFRWTDIHWTGFHWGGFHL